MTQIRIALHDTVRGRRLKLNLPADVPLARLVPALARKLGLPEGEYTLTVEGAAVPLAVEATLAGAGVGAEAVLRLERTTPKAPPVEAEPLGPLEAPLAEPAPALPSPAEPIPSPPTPLSPAEPALPPIAPAREAGPPAWAWAVSGTAVVMACGLLLLIAAALVVGGMWVSEQEAGQKAATSTAQARATVMARARATDTAQAAQPTATAQAARATDTARAVQATATAQVRATTTARAQATATARVRATATAQARATSTARAHQTATVRVQKTATARARVTATAIACVHNTNIAPTHWRILLCDPFDAKANGWSTGTYSGELLTGNRQIANGKYRWEAEAMSGVIWRAIPSLASVSDFYLTVRAQRVSGVKDGQYGLVFRYVDKDNFYRFKVRDDQYFRFSCLHEGKWQTLLGPTKASAIQPGRANRLTALAEGSHFRFYINDQYVGEASDSRLSSGKVGVAMELFRAGDTAVFEFDNFEVRAP